MILEMIQIQKVKLCMKQTSVSNTCLDGTIGKHKTSKPVMIKVVDLIPTDGNFVIC